MADKMLRGKGKLYNSEGARVLVNCTYEIQENPEWTGTKSGWFGQCTTESSTIRGGKCVLQLQDNRRGVCMVTPKILSVSGRGTVFNVQGMGKLE